MPDLAQFFHIWGAMISTLALIATLITIIVYTSETRKLRKATVEHNELQLRPCITVYSHSLVRESQHPYFKNIGKSTALNIRVDRIAFEGEKYGVTIEPKRIKELGDLIVNFNTIMEQSASNLFEMILISISNIVGFKFSSEEIHDIIELNSEEIREIKENLVEKKQKLSAFLQSIDEKVLKLRNCHFGLRNLIETSKSLIETHFNAKNLEKFIKKINKYNIFFRKSKKCIEKHSIRFLKDELSYLFNLKTVDKKTFYFNILLYGFSNLVITALKVIKDYINVNYPNVIIRIFICEGSPKTKIGTYNSLTYHDGSSYSLTLKEQGFDNLILVPDSTVDNVVESQSIKLIMIGANGFTENYFKHSAGHAPSIKIARFRKELGNKEWPKSVLIVSSLKFLDSEKVDEYDDNAMENKTGITKELKGCYFWQGDLDTPVREHIWFLKDKKRIKELYDNKIYLYNPREDNVRLTLLDYIISDVGYFCNNKRKQDFNTFISKTKDYMKKNKVFSQDLKKNRI
ncbi:MAG: hypothetical protein ACFE8P_12780 [Promethearchaeota archaeon]